MARPPPPADDLYERLRVPPLRGPLGGVVWAVTGTLAAVIAWDLALTDWADLPRLHRLMGPGRLALWLLDGLVETALVGASVMLPWFAGCYMAAHLLRQRLRRRAAAAAFSATWHLCAHGLVVACLWLLHRGVPAAEYAVLPVAIGGLWGLWLPRVLPADEGYLSSLSA